MKSLSSVFLPGTNISYHCSGGSEELIFNVEKSVPPGIFSTTKQVFIKNIKNEI